jgi:hypothetical protein
MFFPKTIWLNAAFYADSEYNIDFATFSSYNDAQSQIRIILPQGVSFVIPLGIRGLVFFFHLTHQKNAEFHALLENIIFIPSTYLYSQYVLKKWLKNVIWRHLIVIVVFLYVKIF